MFEVVVLMKTLSCMKFPRGIEESFDPAKP